MPTLILYTIVSLLYLILILFIIRKYRNPIGYSFLAFLFGLFLWTTTLYAYFFIALGDYLLFIGRLNYAAACPLTFGLAAFFHYFPKQTITLPKFF